MKKSYTYYLITQFNIVQSWFKDCTEDNGRNNLHKFQTPEWLAERFRLFEAFCLPSIVNQTAEFTWLVLFNSETPEVYKERIASYQAKYPYFVPLYLKPYTDDLPVLQQYIYEHSKTPYIITTKCDNDDILHRDYMQLIQNQFAEQECTMLHYASGMQYDVQNQILYSCQYLNNHFHSVIERCTPTIHTVLQIDDRKAYNMSYMEFGNHKTPMWVELVHGCNVYNRIMNWNMRPLYCDTKNILGSFLPLNKMAYTIAMIKYQMRRLFAKLKQMMTKKHND